MDSKIAPSTQPIYRGVQFVWFVFGILETILALRLILKALGANPVSGFANFVYSLTYPFVAPFQSVFSTTNITGSTLEWTTLLALVVYWILAIILIQLLLMGKSVSTKEASFKLREQEL